MVIRGLISLFFCLTSLSVAAQGTLLDRLNSELSPLSRLEKLFVIKLAENKITEQLRAIAENPAIRNEGPVWMMKVASFSYGILTLVLEQPFPQIAEIYRARTELYADVVRGKLALSALTPLERKNEARKASALEVELKSLQASEPAPNSTRFKTLTELGPQLGLMIAAHAKIRSTSQPK